MSKKSCLFSFVIGALIIILGYNALLLGFSTLFSEDKGDKDQDKSYTYVYGNKKSSNKILQIDISGIILDSNTSGSPILDLLTAYNVTYGYDIKKQLLTASENGDIKAVILSINSPGGTITGAKAISDGIAQYNTLSSRKVYSHISGLAASGAYWVAASGDKVTADYGSLTGSIGVILGPFKEYNNVLSESSQFGDAVSTEFGINRYYITAGFDKDFDNPYKKMSDKTKQTLQEGINNEYENFVNHVATNRELNPTTIKEEVGALIYENTQANKLGLIDDIKSYDDFVSEVATLSNLSLDDYQVVTQTKKLTFLEELLQSTALLRNQQVASLRSKLENRMLMILPTFSN